MGSCVVAFWESDLAVVSGHGGDVAGSKTLVLIFFLF